MTDGRALELAAEPHRGPADPSAGARRRRGLAGEHQIRRRHEAVSLRRFEMKDTHDHAAAASESPPGPQCKPSPVAAAAASHEPAPAGWVSVSWQPSSPA